MKTVTLKCKLPLLIVSGFALTIFMGVFAMRVEAAGLSCTSTTLKPTCPYFITTGSDIFTGAWFNSGGSCSTNYQGPNYSSPVTDQYEGAIMAYADGSSAKGANSQFGAFSLGYIEGDSGANEYGFLTQSIAGGKAELSFANKGSNLNSNWGGMFAGNNSKGSCISDYYSSKQSPGTSAWAGDFTAKGLFTMPSGTFNGGAVATVAAGSNIAIFVNGDLTIANNIVYGPHIASTTPKFVFVVKGDIYIDKSVTRLDGWYIAQPNGANGGIIWTCTDKSTEGNPAGGETTDKWMKDNCGNQLVVNGALTAAGVRLGRITVGGPGIPGTPAETINYNSDMVTGGGFFNSQNKTSGKIQNLISLPPVF